MGQTKTVKVFRYVMENTVEEVIHHQTGSGMQLVIQVGANASQNILILQKKKANLAKFTMDGNSGDGVSGNLEVGDWFF